jgi:hypothetical protein
MVSPVTVTVTKGSDVYSASAVIPNSGAPRVLQSVTYSISGIPAGTYSALVTVNFLYAGSGGSFDFGYPTYAVDGETPVSITGATLTGSASPFLMTIPINTLTIGASETIDIDAGVAPN